MTDILDNESKEALIGYRVERSHRTLAEVEILLNNQLYSTAVNRLYYAVYYSAIALLLKDGYYSATHAGVRSLLGIHYIKTGKIKAEIGRGFMILFERRHRADYDDFIDSTKEEVMELIPLAQSFIDAVDKIIEGSRD